MGNEKNRSSPRTDPANGQLAPIYEIRVTGCMDSVFWADWFGGMEFSMDPDKGATTLRGPLADQAELYGLLTRLRNRGLTLISVQQICLETKTS